ncbi:TetR/AcrR family transcriptional regulator [Nonomuraea guangzhouensis]|uniref:TetR/AcrR family transcriptional regulator C-terminal ligand-binding domain-containing protein n=1 Tax=Nonomuraea guangzhouensis TaxID=1291555 RepID=A0ABW4GLE5_9ACTN|nr:TetR/AcrR family transcriptional regulator [Nonomuraea guangzhouensis]
MEPVRRPGGRSARVRTAVHEAVLDLLGMEDWDSLSIAQVAERSGVHQATLYRRWGTLGALIDDVVTERLSQGSPVPDTGTLRGDLEAYAVQVAADVAGPLGPLYVRAAQVGTRVHDDDQLYMMDRAVQLQGMLERAAARGESPPTLLELMEVVIAPLYYHAIFFNRPVGADHARTLVDRLLSLPQ